MKLLDISTLLLVVCFLICDSKCNEIRSSAYFMPLDNNPQSIQDILDHSKLKHLILAFVLATNQGECVPTWNGLSDRPVSDDQHVLSMIQQLRQHGGDVAVSFGGAGGIELGHACQTPDALAAAYQLVIDKYNLTHVDFDIEQNALNDADEQTRRFDAIKILKETAKQNGKKLYVSLTIPTTRQGLNKNGLDEIKRGISEKAEIDLYTVMAFDFGGSASDMILEVLGSLEYVHQQLKELYPNSTDQQIHERMGVILMNGHTDQPSELFTRETFENVVQYATNHQLSRVAFWSLNRDRPCPPNTKQWVTAFCSSVPQEPFEFSNVVAEFEHSGH